VHYELFNVALNRLCERPVLHRFHGVAWMQRLLMSNQKVSKIVLFNQLQEGVHVELDFLRPAEAV
jgi:hypothetical protein